MRGISLRLALLFAFAGTLSSTPHSNIRSSETSTRSEVLVGWFHTVCFDELWEGRAGARYFLIDNGGGSAEILLSADLLQSLPDSPGLAPRFGEVHGEWIESGGRACLKASSLEFADTATPAFDGVRMAKSSNSARVGSQPWVIILCKFADVPAEPRTVGYYRDLLSASFPGMDHFWREVSYDTINLENSRVAGWYVLPHPRSYYVYGDPLWLDQIRALRDATAVADRDVYFPSYAGIALFFNDFVGEKYLGYGGPMNWTLDGVNRTWGVTWLPPTLLHGVYGHDRNANHHVFAHEMGHAMGLPHSSGSYGDTYDNLWDLMSYWGSGTTDPTFGLQAMHTTAYHKDLLGWIAPEEKYLAAPGTQETIHLSRLALPQTRGFKMAQIPLPGAHVRFYTAEARRRVGYDAGLYGEAVILYDVDPDRYSPTQWGSPPEWKPSEVIDTDGNGFTGDDGAMQTPGEVFSDPANGISIAVESASDSGFTVTINNNAKFLPHFANGSGTQSTLVLANPSVSQDVSGTVRFFAPNGNPLRLAINGQVQDGSYGFHLPARGVGYYATDGKGELQTGSIEVGSNARIEASLVLAGQTGSTGISASSLSTTGLVVPVEVDPSHEIRSGVVLSNPNAQDISVSCQLRSADGSPMPEAAAAVTVAAHGQLTLFADEVFSWLGSATFRGTLVATSSLPFNGVTILRAGPGQFATLPAAPIDRVAKAGLVGVVSTFAGQATARGSVDGELRAARFASPNDITADKTGNLYVADTANHTIRKITPEGIVSTMAGLAGSSGSQDGIGASARFSSPRGLCSDENGTLFIADYGNHIIRKLTPDGAVTTVAGLAGAAGGADGAAGVARFNGPRGVAVDISGDVYVSDTSNHAIRRIASDGTVSTVAGFAGTPGHVDGAGANARFDGPQKIALDSARNLLVADYNNCVIRKISPQGDVTTLSGTPGLHGAMDGPPEKALFGYPLGMAIDPSDNLYVSDGWIVRRVAKDGSVRTLAGSPKINTTPNTSLSGSRDGTGSEARFALPSGLTMHPSGSLLVADRDNHAIRQLALDAAADTVYFSQFADGEGFASTLLLVNPSSVEPTTGTIEFRDSLGQPLALDLNGALVLGNYMFNLAPGGSAWLRTDGLGTLVVGSVKITSDIPIRSTLLFSGFLGLGGLDAARPASQLRIPFETDDAQYLDTGVAFSNPASVPVSISLRLRDTDRNLVEGGAANIVLPARGQLARFPRELFAGKPPGLGRFRGTLEVDASTPICAMALRLSPGALVPLPVIR